MLASASPRRLEMVRSIWPEVVAMPADLDESTRPNESPWETAERLARSKALATHDLHPDDCCIGGDTVVAYRGLQGYRQLAKPEGVEHAERMLRELSGREHWVISGVAVASPGFLETATETTTVCFRHLSQNEISSYAATGEPMDKAGGYAIQGGARGFASFTQGSLTNVIGLPLERVLGMVRRARCESAMR